MNDTSSSAAARIGWAAATVVIVLGLNACAGVRATSRTEDFNEVGEREESYSRETTFLTRKGEAQLEAAKALERQGEYKQAIAALDKLYLDGDLNAEIRQEVLLNLGEMHGAWMNAFKDYEKGLLYLRELLAEFPDTEHRLRAEELMGQYTDALQSR